MKDKLRLNTGRVATFALATIIPMMGLAHHDSGNDGHIPKDVNYGFDVVGRDTLGGVEDGLYTDVWSHNGYA